MSGREKQRFHLCYRTGKAVENRLGDDGMTDVELNELLDRGDRRCVVIVQAMTTVNDQPATCRVCGRRADSSKLLRDVRAARVRIGATR